ncbi:DUF3459 domain-containing protein [Paenibacillus sp. strain BS8-2]
MAALSFTLPGMPLIYSGQEAGLDRRLLFFDKDEITWEDLPLQSFYQHLIQLKHDNPALWNGSAGGEFHSLETLDKGLLAFERSKDDNSVVVIMNLSAEPVASTVKLGSSAGSYLAASDGSIVTLAAEHAVTFAPWAYEIYIKQ